MNFLALQNQSLSYRGTTASNEDASVLLFLRQSLNDKQREALSFGEFPWASREWKFITEATYVVGTVICTQGNSLITEQTAAANSWSADLEGRWFANSTNGELYEVVKYVPNAVGTNAGLRIDPPYYRPTATNATYAIYKANYDLPGDFHQMRSVRNESQDDFVQYVDQWEFDHRIPRLLDQSPAQFRFYSITKRTREPLLTNSGEVVLTAFSDVATFSGATLTVDQSGWRGATLRLSGTTTVVGIRGVTATNKANLYEVWKGSTSTSQSFEVVPSGQYQISLWPLPYTTEMVAIRYYHQPLTMANTDDVPILPEAFHDFLWKGAAYELMVWEGNPEMAPLLQLMQGQYEEAKLRIVRAARVERDMIPQRGLYKGSWRHPHVLRFPNEFPNRLFRGRW